jgi:glycosyltransferase involved in cell wall biosynthesis
MFSQLAVLLNGGEAAIGFQWIGQAAHAEARLLKAAGIHVLGMEGKDHALHLAMSWMYVSTDTSPGFPIALISAMAVGLPCVAFDCAQHRNVISHGETGYLCADVQEFLECICALLEDKQLRMRIGQAAQQQAILQFKAGSLGRRLFAAYSLSSVAHARPGLKGKS